MKTLRRKNMRVVLLGAGLQGIATALDLSWNKGWRKS